MRDGEGDAEEGKEGRRVAAIEKLRQLSNSIKVPARMLTAPKLKEAANADKVEDEDVAQSDRLQDEPAETETETELLYSFSPFPSTSLLVPSASLARERQRLRLQLQHVGSFCTH